jgi:hypothetical protein
VRRSRRKAGQLTDGAQQLDDDTEREAVLVRMTSRGQDHGSMRKGVDEL